MKSLKKFLLTIVLVLFCMNLTGCVMLRYSQGGPQNGDVNAVRIYDSTQDVYDENMAMEDAEELIDDLDEESTLLEEDIIKVEFEVATDKTGSNYSTTITYSNLDISPKLDTAVSEAIIKFNNNKYIAGEFCAEGHIILDYSNSKSGVVVYALASYGEYGFRDNMFIKAGGSGAVPVILSFNIDNGQYILTSYFDVFEGANYVDLVTSHFPSQVQNRVLVISDSDKAALQVQERLQAKNYLIKIGRSATIGEESDLAMKYPDIDYAIIDELGKKYWDYPYWIGTLETLEDGERYVYETKWDGTGSGSGTITYTKYIYSTNEIVKTISVKIDKNNITQYQESVLILVENNSLQ